MRVMVTGASGLLGSYLYREFSSAEKSIGAHYNNPTLGTEQLDLLKFDDVDSRMRDLQPTLIIHCAAEDKPDICEQKPEETRALNLEATVNLAKQAKKHNAKFVFFSTDYVFDGRIGPYRESDTPMPINEYGLQKFDAEKKVAEIIPNHLILRLALIYGVDPHHRSYLVRFVRNLTNSTVEEVPTDLLGTPVYARQIADVTRALVEKDARGLFHVGGSEFMSRYDFCDRITDIFDLDRRFLKPVRLRQMGKPAARPLNAGLVSSNVEKATGIKMYAIRSGLQQLRDDLNKKGWDILSGPLD